MSQFSLYVDCDRGLAVVSDADSTAAQLPPFVLDDTLSLKIILLTGYSRASTYTKVPVMGITIEVALGTREGVEYATQFAWTASADLADPYWTAVLPLNTAPLNGLLAGQPQASVTLEVKRIDAGGITTVLQQDVTVKGAVIRTDSVIPPAGQTPLSLEAANALFVPISGFKGKIRIISPDGTQTADLYLGDDGSFHVDPVT